MVGTFSLTHRLSHEMRKTDTQGIPHEPQGVAAHLRAAETTHTVDLDALHQASRVEVRVFADVPAP